MRVTDHQPAQERQPARAVLAGSDVEAEDLAVAVSRHDATPLTSEELVHHPRQDAARAGRRSADLGAIAHTEVSGLGNVVDFSAHGPISPRGGWG